MKFKTSSKAVRDGYRFVIKVGYCSLQHLLQWHNPIAYTAGVYGWNADVYDFGNIAIVTGYRPFGNIEPDYDVIREYETAAEKIVYDRSMEFEEKRERLDKMISEMIRKVIGWQRL